PSWCQSNERRHRNHLPEQLVRCHHGNRRCLKDLELYPYPPELIALPGFDGRKRGVCQCTPRPSLNSFIGKTLTTHMASKSPEQKGAEALSKLKDKASKLGVEFTDETTVEELTALVEEAEGKDTPSEDPEALKARIVELEEQLKDAKKKSSPQSRNGLQE